MLYIKHYGLKSDLGDIMYLEERLQEHACRVAGSKPWPLHGTHHHHRNVNTVQTQGGELISIMDPSF